METVSLGVTDSRGRQILSSHLKQADPAIYDIIEKVSIMLRFAQKGQDGSLIVGCTL